MFKWLIRKKLGGFEEPRCWEFEIGNNPHIMEPSDFSEMYRFFLIFFLNVHIKGWMGQYCSNM